MSVSIDANMNVRSCANLLNWRKYVVAKQAKAQGSSLIIHKSMQQN